jgi:mercuric ion transport protein
MRPPLIEIYSNPDELIIDDLRERVMLAMQKAGFVACWKEYYPGNENIPGHVKSIFPPVLLINRKTVWTKEDNLPAVNRLIETFESTGRSLLKIRYRKIISSYISFAMSLFIAFFPKCPVCWASYITLFGWFGSNNIPYKPWFLPVSIFFLLVNLSILYLNRKRHNSGPFALSLFGALIIIVNRLYIDSFFLVFIGACFLITASLWNSISGRLAASIRYHLNKIIN